MKKKETPPLTDEIKKKIVDRWRFSPLNSIPKLAEEFKCTKIQVHKVINDYLSTNVPSK